MLNRDPLIRIYRYCGSIFRGSLSIIDVMMFYPVENILEAPENDGKVFVANSLYSIAFPEADGSLITPLIYDPEYVPRILEYREGNDIKFPATYLNIND